MVLCNHLICDYVWQVIVICNYVLSFLQLVTRFKLFKVYQNIVTTSPFSIFLT
jgi:hypothetical protein